MTPRLAHAYTVTKHHAGPINRAHDRGTAGVTENGPQNGVGYGVRSLREGRGTGYGSSERVGVRGTEYCPRTPVMGPSYCPSCALLSARQHHSNHSLIIVISKGHLSLRNVRAPAERTARARQSSISSSTVLLRCYSVKSSGSSQEHP